MKPKFLFGYVYYRLSEIYLKFEGKNPSTAIAILAFMQGLWIASILIMVHKFLFVALDLAPYVKYIRPAVLALGVLIIISNYMSFNDKYDEFKEYWANESKSSRSTKGWVIVAMFMLPVATMVLSIITGDKT